MRVRFPRESYTGGIALSDPGIDDFAQFELLWSRLQSPTIIDIEAVLELLDRDGGRGAGPGGRAIRRFGPLRSQGDRFILNGRPLPLRLVLDQGYWQETGLTAPDDAALQRDIDLVKRLGFNGVTEAPED